MIIKIYKEEDIVYFKIDKDIFEFNHENINVFIDKVIENNYQEIKYDDIDKELANYKELLTGIYNEINNDDFKESLSNIKEKEKEINVLEEE